MVIKFAGDPFFYETLGKVFMTHRLTQAVARKFSRKLGFLYSDLVTSCYRIVGGGFGQA